MTALKQVSFAGGELAPNLYGRSDLSKWQAGLAICRNFSINRYGNLENRGGSVFVGKQLGMSRIIPFVISSSQSYEITFRPDFLYTARNCIWMDVWANGARLALAAGSVGTYNAGTTYARGQIVSYGGGFWVSDQDSNLANTPAAGGLQPWYALAVDGGGNPFVSIPFTETKLADVGYAGQSLIPLNAAIKALDYGQINQAMFMVSHYFAPIKLEYHADNWWRINGQVIANPLGYPLGMGVAGSGSGTIYQYRVVAVAADLTTQGPVGRVAILQASSIVAASGVYTVTTGTAHGIPTGAVAQLSFAYGDLAVNTDYVVTSTGTFTFTITTGAQTIASLLKPGTTWQAATYDSVAVPSASVPNKITWTAASGAAKYFVYRYYLNVWGYIGSTTGLEFDDINIVPDVGFQPAADIPMLQTAQDWPAVVGVFQQRLWFANTSNQPQSYWASRTGQYGVFNVSTPANAADAFTFVLAGKQVQFITAFADIGKLVIHTSSGEFLVNGDQAGAITSTAQNVGQIGYAGSLPGVQPVGLGLTDLFVQARGGLIRDLRFDVQVFNYTGKDTTLFASHLFAGKTVVQMAWQQVPDSILWVALSDGSLVGMTYIREHEMWAWHRHDTSSGQVIGITVVPEGAVEAVYLLVTRQGTQMVERLQPRAYADLTLDACFTDCSLRYDGRNATATTVTVTTAGGWTPTDTLTITASSGVFVANDATYRNVINLRQLDAGGNLLDQVNLTVIGYASATVVTAQAQKTVPAWAQVALTTWGKAVSHFSGYPLTSIAINILGDGNVEPQTTVDGAGAFVTQRPYLNLWAGLPITAQAVTLDWENQQGETIAGKRKNINELTAIFVNSRGGRYGPAGGKLFPFPQKSADPHDAANYLLNDPFRFPVAGWWTKKASVMIQQTDPLPMCISAIIPTGEVGN